MFIVGNVSRNLFFIQNSVFLLQSHLSNLTINWTINSKEVILKFVNEILKLKNNSPFNSLQVILLIWAYANDFKTLIIFTSVYIYVWIGRQTQLKECQTRLMPFHTFLEMHCESYI